MIQIHECQCGETCAAECVEDADYVAPRCRGCGEAAIMLPLWTVHNRWGHVAGRVAGGDLDAMDFDRYRDAVAKAKGG